MLAKDEIVESGVKFYYELTSVMIDAEEDLRYTTYGVKVLDREQSVVVAYPDVSTDREFVREIVEKCNRHGLHALHLEDILLDSIG